MTLTVFRHDGSWCWLCPVCATSESGFDLEHHARTIGDEHLVAHAHDELDGGAVLADPPAPAVPEQLVTYREHAAQARARSVLTRVDREVPV